MGWLEQRTGYLGVTCNEDKLLIKLRTWVEYKQDTTEPSSEALFVLKAACSQFCPTSPGNRPRSTHVIILGQFDFESKMYKCYNILITLLGRRSKTRGPQ